MDEIRVLRNVSLAPKNYNKVKEVAEEHGFGGKGFSAALNYIISVYDELTTPTPPEKGNDKGAEA